MIDNFKIENQFKKFLEAYPSASCSSCVEYIGLNFSALNTMPIFKAYYETKKSLEHPHPLLQPLIKKGLIRTLNRIDDTVNSGKVRYEIGLRHRTNENMLWLYDWIFQLSPALKLKAIDEINNLSRLKCSEHPLYQYASMYFMGLIINNLEEIEAIKFHYLLRVCSDTDKINKNFHIDNEGYLCALKNTNIQAFSTLSDRVFELIKNIPAELWIAAVDYYIDKAPKYKIYIKNFSSDDMCKCLMFIMNDNYFKTLVENIKSYRHWLISHQELKLYGIALCLSEDGQWSLNFYHEYEL